MHSIWLWVGFNVLVLALLALDLGVLHRKAHVIGTREAAGWSVFWIALSLIFNAGVWYFMGPKAGLEFLTGYLIEKALSVDNIFVFVLIFAYFQVPPKYQHRVLFWGIIGALVMRGAMIAAGAFLLERFHWIIYVFGGFLVITGIRMAFHDEADIKPESNPVLRLVRKIMPVTSHYHGQRLLIRRSELEGDTVVQPTGGGSKFPYIATPLLIVLLVVETTDLIFALDSIPAIFAITRDPFLVYTSNVFAILGLRALYFLLASVIERFHYLKLGLSIILVFVGTKMLLSDIYHLPIGLSLGFVALVLVLSVVLSLMFPKAAEEHAPVIHDPLAPGDTEVPPEVLDPDDKSDPGSGS